MEFIVRDADSTQPRESTDGQTRAAWMLFGATTALLLVSSSARQGLVDDFRRMLKFLSELFPKNDKKKFRVDPDTPTQKERRFCQRELSRPQRKVIGNTLSIPFSANFENIKEDWLIPCKRTSDKFDYDVFICHCGESKAFALQLSVFLSALGMNVWIDRLSIRIGSLNTERIGNGLSTSRKLIVIVDELFLSKEWPQREFLSWVIHRGVDDVIPIFFDVNPSDLKHRHGILHLATGKPVGDILRSISGFRYCYGQDKASMFSEIVSELVIFDKSSFLKPDFIELFISVCESLKRTNMLELDSHSYLVLNEERVTKDKLTEIISSLRSRYEIRATYRAKLTSPKQLSSPNICIENSQFSDLRGNALEIIKCILKELSKNPELVDAFLSSKSGCYDESKCVDSLMNSLRLREVERGSIILSVGFSPCYHEDSTLWLNTVSFFHFFNEEIHSRSFFLQAVDLHVEVDLFHKSGKCCSEYIDDVSNVLLPNLSQELPFIMKSFFSDEDSSTILISPRHYLATMNQEYRDSVYICCVHPVPKEAWALAIKAELLGFKTNMHLFKQNSFDPEAFLSSMSCANYFIAIFSDASFLPSQQAFQWQLAHWLLIPSNEKYTFFVGLDVEFVESRNILKLGFKVQDLSNASLKKPCPTIGELLHHKFVNFRKSLLSCVANPIDEILRYSIILNTKLIFLSSKLSSCLVELFYDLADDFASLRDAACSVITGFRSRFSFHFQFSGSLSFVRDRIIEILGSVTISKGNLGPELQAEYMRLTSLVHLHTESSGLSWFRLQIDLYSPLLSTRELCDISNKIYSCLDKENIFRAFLCIESAFYHTGPSFFRIEDFTLKINPTFTSPEILKSIMEVRVLSIEQSICSLSKLINGKFSVLKPKFVSQVLFQASISIEDMISLFPVKNESCLILGCIKKDRIVQHHTDFELFTPLEFSKLIGIFSDINSEVFVSEADLSLLLSDDAKEIEKLTIDISRYASSLFNKGGGCLVYGAKEIFLANVESCIDQLPLGNDSGRVKSLIKEFISDSRYALSISNLVINNTQQSKILFILKNLLQKLQLGSCETISQSLFSYSINPIRINSSNLIVCMQIFVKRRSEVDILYGSDGKAWEFVDSIYTNLEGFSGIRCVRSQDLVTMDPLKLQLRRFLSSYRVPNNGLV